MNENKITVATPEEYLLSKAAIGLSPKERLVLLFKAKRYPVVKNRTSAEAQIKEMIDLYDLCCLMMAQYFPNQQAEDKFCLLNIALSQKDGQLIGPGKLSEAINLLHSYEELENKVSAIQLFFYKCGEAFPDLYERYNLEELATEQISDIVETSRKVISDDPTSVKRVLNRWGLY